VVLVLAFPGLGEHDCVAPFGRAISEGRVAGKFIFDLLFYWGARVLRDLGQTQSLMTFAVVAWVILLEHTGVSFPW
jgi:hypothetical protein